MSGLRILTWHVHGSYLHYLTHAPHRFYLPVGRGREPGYGGRTPNFAWGDNVVDIPFEDVRNTQFDAILYQSPRNWQVDRDLLLTPAQKRLPQLYLEHDPPQEHPTNTRHPVDDPNVTVVHCTHFNALMWDSGRSPVRVVEHGVLDRGHLYTGATPRGIVVVNDLQKRGRRLGADIFERARAEVPLDLVGMNAEAMGGLGEVPLAELPAFSAAYRFFFHPIRYTSLGLALLEAMMAGLPIVGLATTELSTIIRDGENGFIATDEAALIERMRALIADPALAKRLGDAGRKTALARFNIDRFAADWDRVLREAVGTFVSQVAA